MVRKKEITFSTDTGKSSIKDNYGASRFSEEYFETEEDPAQFQPTKENILWVRKNIPDCFNAIKYKGVLIGYSFIIPCSRKLMELFLLKKLTENRLFQEVKKSADHRNFETIYMCGAVVKPEFRRRGLASAALIKSIRKITGTRRLKPTLFYWEYSRQGGKLASYVAKILGFRLKKRT